MSKGVNRTESVSPSVRMQLLQMGSAYLLSRALHVAAELGIADVLLHGAKSPDEIARLTKCNEDSLYRLLRTLAASQSEKKDGRG